MKKAAILICGLICVMGAFGCGVDKGEISDSGGPPKGGPPAQTEHPPGLSDAEKKDASTR